jgi:putative iron-regulated protein
MVPPIDEPHKQEQYEVYFMNKTIFALLMTLSFSAIGATPKEEYAKGYAAAVYQDYTASVTSAEKMKTAIDAFLANPSDATLAAARTEWVEARKLYSNTEVYRFSDGPIDNDNGPEGQINAWPLDEGYIDYTQVTPNSGIINDVAAYPIIDEDLLVESNEKDGEKNISTGWHAIEFLLWGQDLSTTGPGNRPYTDYIVGVGVNADRRATYLSVVTNLLVKDLKSVQVQWDPSDATDYAATYVTAPDSFAKAIASAKFLASDELSGERMFVAWDAQDQEDEHSCFSDTTHNDIYHNFIGIKNVLSMSYNGVSFVELVKAKDATLAQQISDNLVDLDNRFKSFKGPFDNAIFDTEGRAELKAMIDGLRLLAVQIGDGMALL